MERFIEFTVVFILGVMFAVYLHSVLMEHRITTGIMVVQGKTYSVKEVHINNKQE